MLTVDVEKRISIDECLDHPWTRNAGYVNPADSLDGLTGQMNAFDFSKRKLQRERTLLANINDIKVSKVVQLNGAQQIQGNSIDIPGSPARVKVWEKNPAGKNVMTSAEGKKTGKGKKNDKAKEEHPAAHRQQEEFMNMGGNGDMQLFADDTSSRYLPDEVPKGQK